MFVPDGYVALDVALSELARTRPEWPTILSAEQEAFLSREAAANTVRARRAAMHPADRGAQKVLDDSELMKRASAYDQKVESIAKLLIDARIQTRQDLFAGRIKAFVLWNGALIPVPARVWGVDADFQVAVAGGEISFARDGQHMLAALPKGRVLLQSSAIPQTARSAAQAHGTVGAENRAAAHLKAEVAKSTAPRRRAEVVKSLVDSFNISKRAAMRVWEREAPAEWKSKGRPRLGVSKRS